MIKHVCAIRVDLRGRLVVLRLLLPLRIALFFVSSLLLLQIGLRVWLLVFFVTLVFFRLNLIVVQYRLVALLLDIKVFLALFVFSFDVLALAAFHAFAFALVWR